MTYGIITHRETFRAVFCNPHPTPIQPPPPSPEVSEALHSVSEALPTACESLSVSAAPKAFSIAFEALPAASEDAPFCRNEHRFRLGRRPRYITTKLI